MNLEETDPIDFHFMLQNYDTFKIKLDEIKLIYDSQSSSSASGSGEYDSRIDGHTFQMSSSITDSSQMHVTNNTV